MIWSIILGKILTTVMSWLDAGNLRNKMYKQAEEAEIMHTGLEDIVRMDPNGPMGKYAQKVLDLVKNLE
jgi:hypothetical protein